MCECGSERIARVSGKTSDMCYFEVDSKERNDYVPSNVGIGGGDYVDFHYCLDCGRIQGSDFPVSEDAVEEAFGGNDRW
jgi:hypothetical protein